MAGGDARIPDSKRQKHDGDEDVYDRISALPNVLLTHILSFLPTEEAVRTCVLSKRWKFAWTSISKLEFIEAQVSEKNKRINEQSFEKFVDGVLGRHDALFINKFILQCWSRDSHHRHRPLHVSKWISAAITLNVEELDILVRGLKPVALPPCLYTCGRLKVLKLRGILTLQVPELVCLNSLKILWLQGIMFLEDNSLKKLLSGSQFLDELLVRTIPWNSRSPGISSPSYISSPSLKILKIQDRLGYPKAMDYSIVVDAPNMTLLHISIEDARRKCYTVKNSPNLVSAHIEINSSPDADVFVKLLQNISHISRLSLMGLTKDLLEGDHYQNVPVFHNLKHLTIEILQGGWQHMTCILERSPNLASLSLNPGNFYPEWHQPDHVPGCFSLHLEEVMIRNFEGWDGDLQVIEYLLKCGTVLKKMVICPSDQPIWIRGGSLRPTKLKLDVFKQMLMFPRGSATCQIVFC